MATYTQAGLSLSIATPLGQDAVLLEKFHGTEALSELFHFRLDLLAEDPIDFDRLLGQNVTIRVVLANGTERWLNGIINSLSAGAQVAGLKRNTTLRRYEAELAPALWLLTQRVQSRIFQNRSVPDILKQILHDDWQLKVTFQLVGTYQPRNYCVQYRETDFAFVSRLMEEEGIFYFFQHGDKSHTLFVTDSSLSLGEVAAPSAVVYDTLRSGQSTGPRVWSWRKTQKMVPYKFTLQDYCFQMPHSDLTRQESVSGSVAAGTVKHQLNHQCTTQGTDMLEIHEFPGRFAHCFDEVDKLGAVHAKELEKLFADNERLVKIRMEESAARSLNLGGAGDAANFITGQTFTLAQHFDADGSYLLTRVEHRASLQGVYTALSQEKVPIYENTFACIPSTCLYRPPRGTPEPKIEGTQTAVVVGPKGQEIFIDKYGRVKVRFHWDRQAGADGERSCWIRVAQFWAGNSWGAFFWPRIGHEVVVAFEEGNPDRPLIIGSVYNAANMPPLSLPAQAMRGGIKSCIFFGNPAVNANAIIFHDAPQEAYVQVHSEKNEISHSESTKIHYVARANANIQGSMKG